MVKIVEIVRTGRDLSVFVLGGLYRPTSAQTVHAHSMAGGEPVKCIEEMATFVVERAARPLATTPPSVEIAMIGDDVSHICRKALR